MLSPHRRRCPLICAAAAATTLAITSPVFAQSSGNRRSGWTSRPGREHLADDVEQHPERREPPVRLHPLQPRRNDRRGPPPGRVSGERQHLLQPLPALRRSLLRPEHQPRHGRGHVRRLVPFLAAGRHRHHAEFGRHRQHRHRRSQPLHSNGRRVHAAGLPAAGPRPRGRRRRSNRHRDGAVRARFFQPHLRGDGDPPGDLRQRQLRRLDPRRRRPRRSAASSRSNRATRRISRGRRIPSSGAPAGRTRRTPIPFPSRPPIRKTRSRRSTARGTITA